MSGPCRSFLAVVLAVGLLSGCGGGGVKEANTYVDAVNRAQNRFADTIDMLGARITSTSTPTQDRATLGRFQTAVDRVVGDLRAVDPPDSVRKLHGQLIATMEGFGGQVAEASQALASGSASKLLEAQDQLATATADVSRRINATIASINHQLNE